MKVRGVDLELHPEPDYVSDFIRASGDFYEADILDDLVGRLAGGVIVDAGAMLGNHSAYLAAFAQHDRIHAFEPVPSNLALLRRNVVPYPTVRVHPVALSDKDGHLTMAVEPSNRGHGFVTTGDYPAAWGKMLTVRSRTLDSYAFSDVSLIKIDVEWHEPQVLAGARETIARCRPLILIEDWAAQYAPLLPGYRLAAEWATAHQTFLYESSP